MSVLRNPSFNQRFYIPEKTFELTDAKGETRTVRENGAITLKNRLNGLTAHFHLHGCETPVSPLLRRTRGFHRNIPVSDSTKPRTVAVGDGFRLPMDEYWFTQPSDEPDSGCMRLTHTEYGAWMESDARLFDRTPDGTWHVSHGLPHWHESEVDVTGWKATRFPAVRTFGTTDLKWLAGKQVEESVELDHAVSNWLSDSSAANHEHVLDELADLLQTVSVLRGQTGRLGHHRGDGTLLGEEHAAGTRGWRIRRRWGCRSIRTKPCV